jgi:hypothetical protein
MQGFDVNPPLSRCPWAAQNGSHDEGKAGTFARGSLVLDNLVNPYPNFMVQKISLNIIKDVHDHKIPFRYYIF